MNETNGKVRKCISCGFEANETMAVHNGRVVEVDPKPGNICLCAHCGHLMAYAEDMSYRELNDGEMLSVAGDQDVLRLQKQRAKAKTMIGQQPLKHTYPSKYPPGTNWQTDEAWRILDVLPPGALSMDARAWLAGAIAGTINNQRSEAAKIAETLGAPHVAQAIREWTIREWQIKSHGK